MGTFFISQNFIEIKSAPTAVLKLLIVDMIYHVNVN